MIDHTWMTKQKEDSSFSLGQHPKKPKNTATQNSLMPKPIVLRDEREEKKPKPKPKTTSKPHQQESQKSGDPRWPGNNTPVKKVCL